ncbi:MAG: hypothetical protein ABIQ60_04410, partial [Burkholderiaceae bacterium]
MPDGRAMTRARRVAMLVSLLLAATSAPAATLLQATTQEPRAYGYQVGDVVTRSVSIHAPEGLVLDETSVPQPGGRGKALELRSVTRSGHSESGGRRLEFTLAYQVFLAPPQPRTLEMPSFTLRFDGAPRAQELRVDVWPVTVAPLTPVEPPARRGLGDLQPDTEPPLIDTNPARNRLIAYVALLLLGLGYFVHVYVGVPWWSRAHRPFTAAWRGLRRLRADSGEPQWRAALQQVHRALNQT